MKPLDKQKIAEELAFKEPIYEACRSSAHDGWFDGSGDYCIECGSYEPRELLTGYKPNKQQVDLMVKAIDEYNSRLSAIINYDIVWDCDESPSKHCEYNTETDPMHDSCIYCGAPEERK